MANTGHSYPAQSVNCGIPGIEKTVRYAHFLTSHGRKVLI